MAKTLEFEVDVDVRWDESERRFIARCEEYENLQGLGPTPQDAMLELKEAIQMWLMFVHQSNRTHAS